MATTGTYDAETHWADRALRSGGDLLRAACLDDPIENACIDRVQHRLVAAAFDRLKRLRPLPASRLLDYGCGPGRWISFFQRLGLVYSGVDLVEPMVALARSRWPGVDIRRLENHRIPYPAGTFDIVVSIAVLHHNDYPAQERIMTELRRALKRDGHLVLFEAVGPHAPAGAGECPRPLEEWVALAQDRGLRCRWHRGGRYGILGAAMTKLQRHARRALHRGSFSYPAPATRLLRRVDAVVDPWLLPLLPAKYYTREAMVFEGG